MDLSRRAIFGVGGSLLLAGEAAGAPVDLPPLNASVAVLINFDAQLWIDNKNLGAVAAHKPESFEITPGDHFVSLRRNGEDIWSRVVGIKPRQNNLIDLRYGLPGTEGGIEIGNNEWMKNDWSKSNPQSAPPDRMGLTHLRFYNYTEAVSEAPSGWRLPSDKDWRDLEQWFGDSTSLLAGGRSRLNVPLYGYWEGGASGQHRAYGTQALYWTSTVDPNGQQVMISVTAASIKRLTRPTSDLGAFYSARYVRDI